MPEKLIGRRGGANGKLRICSRPPDQVQSSPVQSPVFLYCSVHDRDTMHSRHRSNLLPRYQLSIRSIDENYAPNYPACIRYDHVFPASIQRTNEHPSRYLSAVYHPIYPRKSQFNYAIDRFLPKVWSKLFGNGDGRILGESAPLPPRSVFQCRV